MITIQINELDFTFFNPKAQYKIATVTTLPKQGIIVFNKSFKFCFKSPTCHEKANFTFTVVATIAPNTIIPKIEHTSVKFLNESALAVMKETPVL